MRARSTLMAGAEGLACRGGAAVRRCAGLCRSLCAAMVAAVPLRHGVIIAIMRLRYNPYASTILNCSLTAANLHAFCGALLKTGKSAVHIELTAMCGQQCAGNDVLALT